VPPAATATDRHHGKKALSGHQHSAVNETLCRSREAVLKQSRPNLTNGLTPIQERNMRTLIFGAVLLAVAAAGFHTLISSSLAAARDSKAATFSERFAPVLKAPLRTVDDESVRPSR
jgi:hypothetical protein